MLTCVHDKIRKYLYLAIIYLSVMLSMLISIDAQTEVAIVRFDHTMNGNLIALGYSDRSIEIRDFTTNQTLATFPDPTQNTTDFLYDLAFSPDGKYLATTFGGYASMGILQIIHTGTLQAQQITTPMGNMIAEVAWNNTGDSIAAKVSSGTGNALHDLFVWDIPSGTIVTQIPIGVDDTIVGIAWHPVSSRLINIDRSGVVVIRDTQTWQIVAPEIEIAQTLTDVDWNNDGTQIIGVDAERVIYIWDGTTGSLITSFVTSADRGLYQLDVNANNDVVVNGTDTIAIVSIDSATVDLIPVPVEATHAIWIDNTTINYTQGSVLEQLSLANEQQTPTPTIVLTPSPTGNFTVEARIGGNDNDEQQTEFGYQMTNTGNSPQGDLSTRIFFSPDAGRSYTDYTLDTFYDSSNAASVSGPVQWDASTAYFIVTYGTSTLASGGMFEFQGQLRFTDYAMGYDSSNDWWRVGLTGDYTATDNIPVYGDGTLLSGQEPDGSTIPTATPAPPTPTPTLAPTVTPDATSTITVQSRLDGAER